MKKSIFTVLTFLFVIVTSYAQRNITGTVTSADGPLAGVTVMVKGTNVGTVTDVDGNYALKVPAGSTVILVSYVGYDNQEITLGASNQVNVTLAEGSVLNELVVTALGVTRYKNDLAYSAQKVDGGELSKARDGNVLNSLSGRVAGLNVKRNNNMGGSTNIVLRGAKSLTGDNQALFVVDGVPIDNTNNNTGNQKRGRLGYDYGSAAADINADDIESVTVLKGAAATALYGSRGANGVILISTKKGSKTNGIGVSVNTGMNWGNYDKTTFAEYQNKYGGGYGAYYEDDSGFFLNRDVDGDGNADLVVPTSEDASWGAAFDPNKQVYQWDAFDPFSPNYGKSKPWVAAENGPSAIFETAVSTSNSVSIDGSNDKGYFKLGYTRSSDKGILPNSSINKDFINFGGSFNLSKKLMAYSSVNYTNTVGNGRYGTGYDSKNLMGQFRQWWQVNTDLLEQKDAYERNGQNVTWNWADPDALVPIYWDNPYWTRYENYQNDQRGRYFGNVGLQYKINNWLNLKGQVGLDGYSEYQEERIAVGSIDLSEYRRMDRTFKELNYDLLLSTNPINIGDKMRFNALAGYNLRRYESYSIRDVTNGGLAVPGLYSLNNSLSSRNPPIETLQRLQVNGLFAQAGLVYDDWAILDLSVRNDKSSSLPADQNSYTYPAASLGLIFSNWIGENNAFTWGKLRLNYAEVGNSAQPLFVYDTYPIGAGTILDRTLLTASHNGATIATIPIQKNNEDLKPERTQSFEVGLETRFLKNRLGLDITYYKMNTFDQIIPVAVSRATGYSSKVINAGNIENKGIELQIFLRPITTKDFDWRIDINWARNRNLVVDLGGEIDNLQIQLPFQGGITFNATVGEPYGTLRGTDFVYHDNGGKLINENSASALYGSYLVTPTANEVIGNVNPDWTGGVMNSFRYKNLNFSFLLDGRKGGDLFSLDLYYGLATGLYPETAVTNDLGGEVRAPLDQNGGIIVDGVLADGSPNNIRYDATNFGIYGYRRNPAAAFIYDASFIKLREVNLSYDLPSSWFGDGKFLRGASIGVYGRNLWIISKNLPYADPEDGLSSGNVQGYQVGSYPSVKVVGVNLGLKF